MLLYNTFFVWAASYDGLMPPMALSEQTPHFRHSSASSEDEESAQILTAGEYARLQSNSPADIRVNRPGVACSLFVVIPVV